MRKAHLLAGLILFSTVLFPHSTTGAEKVEPSVLVIGQLYQKVDIPVCDTLAQVRAILAVHLEHGQEASAVLFHTFNKMLSTEGYPLCGPMAGKMVFVKRFRTHAWETATKRRYLTEVEIYVRISSGKWINAFTYTSLPVVEPLPTPDPET